MSKPRESHPQLLAEPSVNLPIHWAPIVPTVNRFNKRQWGNISRLERKRFSNQAIARPIRLWNRLYFLIAQRTRTRIWRLFQNAAGENPQNSVRAREIRRNNRVRLTLAARRLLLVMAKNSVYASYTLTVGHCNQENRGIGKRLRGASSTLQNNE